MKRIFLIIALLWGVSVSAQNGTPNTNAIGNEGRATYRTRFISYDIRGEAERGEPYGTKYYRPMLFKLNTAARFILFEARADIPALWLDRDVYLRDEGRTGRYRLKINDREVGVNSDTYAGAEFYITPYLKEGINQFALEFTPDIPGADMEKYTLDETRLLIENLYLWSQPKIHIFDYTIAGYPHPEGLDGVVALDIAVVNGYNMPETVNVGYDIYDPIGNLKLYNFTDVTIPGGGCDTVRFRDKLIGYQRYTYSAEHPELYRVVLSVKYNNRPTEYIPLRLGFGTTDFDGEKVTRNGKTVYMSAVENDVPVQRNTLRRLRLMKRRGINTLYLTRPQQEWFYDMCEELGIYLVDCAAVECDPKGDDRGLNGTVANSPDHLARFIDRQQGMYARGKNRANIIGWNIGAPSGNGYNMYKSYQWMKAADSTRVVVYRSADGEWNSDMELPAPRPLEDVLEGMSSRSR
jgi:beta-galactosidase